MSNKDEPLVTRQDQILIGVGVGGFYIAALGFAGSLSPSGLGFWRFLVCTGITLILGAALIGLVFGTRADMRAQEDRLRRFDCDKQAFVPQSTDQETQAE